MRCRYCFYADVSDMRSVKSYGIMSKEVAKTLIERVCDTSPKSVTFAFQGGEPTLAGLDFYRFFVSEAEKTLPEKTAVFYSIQTNGLMIDEEWCRFFKEKGFLVGLSLDGYRELHDFNRPDSEKEGTHSRVIRAASLLEKAEVDFNILTVVTKQLVGRGEKLFKFYKNSGFSYVQLIPCLDSLDGEGKKEYSLSSEGYGAFLKELFPLWAESALKGEYISVRLFDNITRLAAVGECEMCGMRGACSPQLVIEADGGVYPCDFYVLDSYLCGNIGENSIEEILSSDRMREFLKHSVGKGCQSCRYLSFCGGACKRYRDLYFEKEGYCPYKDFLDTCKADIIRVGRAFLG